MLSDCAAGRDVRKHPLAVERLRVGGDGLARTSARSQDGGRRSHLVATGTARFLALLLELKPERAILPQPLERHGIQGLGFRRRRPWGGWANEFTQAHVRDVGGELVQPIEDVCRV